MDFHGKTILLVSPLFYGYEKLISKELRQQGLAVHELFFTGFSKKWYNSSIKESQFIAGLRNRFKAIAGGNKIDFLLVINTDFIDSESFSDFKKNNPGSLSIIYLWDSLKNLSWDNIGNALSQFDKRFSFDRMDCESHPELHLIFRPNFYHPFIINMEPVKNPEYKIASVMSAQPSRVLFINNLMKRYPDMKMHFHIHLLNLKSIPAYLFNHSVLIRFKYTYIRRLKIRKVLEILNNSESILDIPAKNQNGLPFRAIDSIGLNKKLITTNMDIMNYDFYSRDNILVTPPSGIPDIPVFLDIQFKPYSIEIREKYSLKGWIREILDINIPL
jgi:hypothetical protein